MSADPPVALRVRVAVPTFQRPELLRALLPDLVSHAEQVERGRPGATVDVLVVDNDPGRSALDAGLPALSPRITVVAEPRPGIAAARQRAIEASPDHDLLVFIDDDERPCEGWLSALVGTWVGTGAAAVVGRVLAEFQVTPPGWIVAGRFFERAVHPTGTSVPAAAAGNLLLDLRQVRALGVGFTTDIGLRGGEDTLFTRQLTAAGGRIVWCAESAIVDLVPQERATRSWVLRRRYAHGTITTAVELALADGALRRGLVRVRAAGAGSLLVAAGGLRAGYGRLLGSDVHRARGMRSAARGAGRVAGAFGRSYEEYRRDESATSAATS